MTELTDSTTDYRCVYVNGRGEQCRNERDVHHPTLCAFHWHRAARGMQSPDPAADACLGLVDPEEPLDTALGVNRFIARVVDAVDKRRISRGDAYILAQFGYLLLTSLTHLRRELERQTGALALPSGEHDPAALQAEAEESSLLTLVRVVRQAEQRGLPPEQTQIILAQLFGSQASLADADPPQPAEDSAATDSPEAPGSPFPPFTKEEG